MPPFVFLVLARVALGVAANAVQKRLVRDGAGVGRLWLATHSWMLGPALLAAALSPVPASTGFWRDAALAGFLDALGNLAMVAALRGTDLSVFGPLNALRPLLALAFGWPFLGEHPTAAGLGGVVVTVAGAAVLLGGKTAGGPRPDPKHTARIVLLRVAGLSLSTIGAVFLKRAAGAGSAGWVLATWVATGGVVFAAVALARRRDAREPERGYKVSPWGWITFHAAAFLGMQALTIAVFRGTLLAYSFVYFQLGMVLQVVVGRVLFGEPAFARRLLACLVMAAGAGLVLWRG